SMSALSRARCSLERMPKYSVAAARGSTSRTIASLAVSRISLSIDSSARSVLIRRRITMSRHCELTVSGQSGAQPSVACRLQQTRNMGGEKKRILVVDDSEDLREFFQVLLEGAGYEVITASSGAEALEKIRAQRPDLITLDLIMPGMDGLEFLMRMRSDLAPPLPPVILVSGFDLTEEEALRQGALMFVRKPVAPTDLLDFVAHGLRGERVGAELAARERTNSRAARKRTRDAAAAFVAPIHKELEVRAAGQMEWLAAYFGVQTAVVALEENGHLSVF